MTCAPEALRIRPARPEDAPVILHFIRAIAEYEKLASEVTATEEAVRESLFGPRPAAECLLAFLGPTPAGFAVVFTNYSTFLACPGLYLEDLFVEPSLRGRGIGRALFARVARIAVERGAGRLDWSVLDWNEPAIRFYRALGASPLGDWTVWRLRGVALAAFAEASAAQDSD